MRPHPCLLEASPELTGPRNFDDFVCDAYRWLMDYYQDGDKVFIFGFSRGAYTARALAGMIQKVGLLPAGNHNQIKLYVSPPQQTASGR